MARFRPDSRSVAAVRSGKRAWFHDGDENLNAQQEHAHCERVRPAGDGRAAATGGQLELDSLTVRGRGRVGRPAGWGARRGDGGLAGQTAAARALDRRRVPAQRPWPPAIPAAAARRPRSRSPVRTVRPSTPGPSRAQAGRPPSADRRRLPPRSPHHAAPGPAAVIPDHRHPARPARRPLSSRPFVRHCRSPPLTCPLPRRRREPAQLPRPPAGRLAVPAACRPPTARPRRVGGHGVVQDGPAGRAAEVGRRVGDDAGP